MKTYTWQVELTDTFHGEANYCWVRKYQIEAPAGARRRLIIQRAKAAIGWTGLRCKVEEFGDYYTIRPNDICQIAFINLEV
jgi:hypothetical protein